MNLEKKFEKIRKKYEIGIYKELKLETKEEQKMPSFPIELEKKKELIETCISYLPKERQEEMRNTLEDSTDFQNCLSYLHHHYLEGNSLFRYAIEKCSTRWAINYLEEREEEYKIKEPPEKLLYSFLSSCAEQTKTEKRKIRFSQIEYYLYVLELEGKIKREYQTIYLEEKNEKN